MNDTTQGPEGGPWLVVYDEDDVKLYRSERVARLMVKVADAETDGNVTARAVSLRMAYAAPDLLAFARMLAARDYCDCDEPDPGESGTIQCDPCAARAAIAAATEAV